MRPYLLAADECALKQMSLGKLLESRCSKTFFDHIQEILRLRRNAVQNYKQSMTTFPLSHERPSYDELYISPDSVNSSWYTSAAPDSRQKGVRCANVSATVPPTTETSLYIR